MAMMSVSPFTTGSSGCGWLHPPLPDARALNQRARNVVLQYARLKPYTVQHQQKNMHAVILESVDNHVLLGYTLPTKLQRSNTSKRKQVGLAPTSVLSPVAVVIVVLVVEIGTECIDAV
ncbi:hypothetical protein PF005_g3315 [Phytophthora fragariae]|uniref:Uncharacterized protein n=1 Tax=Phytophthora fragariae TaxID=53985 RepID=A0A6A3Z5L6_9STRA|nr:hypothetical protein PF003_g553 [Phytophthora fragariae]KAE8948450.1 hypothetical protein PF009_g1966 [Phytophthora fragariae]KAE9023504.1 hypothetical protein PF011_g3938 [Phytophthora fragariae]KAE9131235.1 hypothetical protein PF010_g3567 [Phytophthora fragariae]KAE9134669.1 hypothetical protein PF007_g2838 [Phytophthora fragariae]